MSKNIKQLNCHIAKISCKKSSDRNKNIKTEFWLYAVINLYIQVPPTSTYVIKNDGQNQVRSKNVKLCSKKIVTMVSAVSN